MSGTEEPNHEPSGTLSASWPCKGGRPLGKRLALDFLESDEEVSSSSLLNLPAEALSTFCPIKRCETASTVDLNCFFSACDRFHLLFLRVRTLNKTEVFDQSVDVAAAIQFNLRGVRNGQTKPTLTTCINGASITYRYHVVTSHDRLQHGVRPSLFNTIQFLLVLGLVNSAIWNWCPQAQNPSQDSDRIRWRCNGSSIVQWRRCEQKRPPLVLPTELCQLIKVEELANGSAPASKQYWVQMPCFLDRCYDKSGFQPNSKCDKRKFFYLRLTSNPGESLATAANCRFQSHSVVSRLWPRPHHSFREATSRR